MRFDLIQNSLPYSENQPIYDKPLHDDEEKRLRKERGRRKSIV